MFISFFYYLRSCGLKVSPNEWIDLMEALHKGLHDSSLMGFYHLARMLLVKSETDFDCFDQAFLGYFEGIKSTEELPQELLDWLNDPISQRPYDKAEVDRRWAGLDLEEIRQMLEERLQEQTERHDGGNKWVGTGGTSMFGHSGYAPVGIRVGGAGQRRSAVQVAAERRFVDFRKDATLNIRQYQMALRRLRRLTARTDGPKDELQLEKTVQSTCNNGGYLKLEFDRPRTNDIRLLLLFDTGGSMEEHTQLCSQLFRACQKENRFKELRTYYFHNCPYDMLAQDVAYWRSMTTDTERLIHELSSEWRVIFVGDGAMALSELTDSGGCMDYLHYNQKSGFYYIQCFAKHFSHLVWLNPLSESSWDYMSSIQLIRGEVPMYPLSVEGLDRALKRLLASR